MIKILIADDHPIFREGLKQILQAGVEDFLRDVQVDEARNGQEVMGQIMRETYDLVILDLNMPGRNGLEVLENIKTVKPELRVLILSMYSEEQYAVRAIKSGASGYLTKEGASRELVTALRKVLSGGLYISPPVAEQLAFGLQDENRDRPPHEQLSAREYQVLCMIAKGKAIKEIAHDLAMSSSAVSTYRSRIMDKMAMKNNAELIRYALKHQLVE